MKKITALFMLTIFLVPAANAAPSYISKDNKSGYKVIYDYKDKEKSGWYASFRAAVNLLSFENKYSASSENAIFPNGVSDSYSMKPVFGGSVAVGKKFGYFWRGEVEAGYTGNFKDADNSASFELAAPYVLMNAMYDFTNGLYLGAGLGAAAPMVTFDHYSFIQGDRTKTTIAPMGALMVGYSYKMDDNFVLDLRYRFSAMTGNTYSRNFATDAGLSNFESKIDTIMENQISVALRYEF